MANTPKKLLLLGILQYMLYLGFSTAVLLLLLECALRMAGYPKGLFDYRPQDGSSLFRPSAKIHLVWDLIPYTIETNTLGFRGSEITLEKPADTTRIIALGDSVTQGFYVDNPDAFPVQMEALLREAGHSVEVVNAAIGDTSIDRQMEMYKRFCERLDPDMVLLTFVANDIDALRGKTKQAVLNADTFSPDLKETSEWLLFGKSAIGEIILDQATQREFKRYRENRDLLAQEDRRDRYTIPDGDAFAENVDIFLRDHAQKNDGIAFYETYNDAHLETINTYLYGLDHFHAYLKEQDIQLMLAYYPDYPEVYDRDRKVPLRGMLQEHCAKEGIPFFDLLPAFQSQGAAVLHLAPLDFHPNPAGNTLMAETLAEMLHPYLSTPH